MRTDVQDITAFYQSPLGRLAEKFISQRLEEAWGEARGQNIAGFGYAFPYMPSFIRADRSLCLVPEGMGVMAETKGQLACLTADTCWPLRDASIDRLLLVHGLEEAANPRRLLREAWRVLTDDGRMIIIVPNRRGPWAMVDSTPFSAGRPYLKGQLERLLQSAMFTPTAWSAALYFPPVQYRFLMRAAKAWERAGDFAWSAFAGVTLVEVRKDMAAPARGSKLEVLNPVLRPVPSRKTVRDLHRKKPSAKS